MISTIFGQIAFTSPWALAALLALPGLYFLLRVMPPAPRTEIFPPLRLLEGLSPTQNTPSHTPWWILLLRMFIAALILLALSGPILNPSKPFPSAGPLRLVIENGWSAAPNWSAITREAESLIRQAQRDNRPVLLLPTIANEDTAQLQTAAAALQSLKGLKPYPWQSAPDTLDVSAFEGNTILLSDGIRKNGLASLIDALEQNGDLQIIAPNNESLPALIKSGFENEKMHFIFESAAPMNGPTYIQVLDQQSQVIYQHEISETGPFQIDLPAELATSAASLRISGQSSAAARYLLETQSGPKSVGIVSGDTNDNTQNLRDDAFFLAKALEPYADITIGALSSILAKEPGVIILPDVANMPVAHLNELDEWVSKGGLLIRFAGPNMTASTNEISLTPVPLRKEMRVLDGSLSWQKPQALKPFDEKSPLFGLRLGDGVTVQRQILPKTDALDGKIWAELEDGTPLITAAPHQSGLLVMIHVSAAPDWSDLPLSGLYPRLLERLLSFAGKTGQTAHSDYKSLMPLRTLDGYGRLEKPNDNVQPIDVLRLDETTPSRDHPPGIYGHEGMQEILNLGDHITALNRLTPAPSRTYDDIKENALFPWLLLCALILFIVDMTLMLALSLSGQFMRRTATIITALILLSSNPTQAQDYSAEDYSQGLYLAYIKTGNSTLNAQTQEGLETLASILYSRTSAEPKGVIGIDPAKDELAFFPILFWSIDASQPALSAEAVDKLQYYIDHGGTIFIDTRDGASGQNSASLKQALSGLNIAPLMPLPEDHVLGRTFYLLDQFPGRLNSGQIWIETRSQGRDGVSSVILGSNDWAGGWSEISLTQLGERAFPRGASHQQELSLRAGINVILYALTGNYKSDQVHVPAILERLGQ